MVGYSLGGWTAMEIAGARFDPDLFAQDCNARPKLGGCIGYQPIKPAETPAAKAQLAAALRDLRVGAVVTLGLSRGFTDASLSANQVAWC